MDIGKEQEETYVIEPLKEPIPREKPEPVPTEPAELPEREREKLPA